MKLIGTTEKEISKYAFDYYSILHLISGIISYFIGFWLLNIFFAEILAILICYICLFIGGIIWEIAENSILISMKVFEKRDFIINSQADVLLVFLGGVIGCITYNWIWIAKIILIGGLFIAFTLGKIFTKIKFWKNPKKKK